MDEIVIKRWCDLHVAEDDTARVEAVDTFSVFVTEGKRAGVPRVVVTCPDHSVQVRAWMSLVRETGQKATDEQVPATPRLKQEQCPACGKQMARQSVINHLVDVHGGHRVKQPAKCPDCGERHPGQTVMASHRRRHGYDYLAEVMATIPKARGRRKE